MGRLIVFEGIDGSGKTTQVQLMITRLERANSFFRRLNFPQYQEPSSALIRMYLGGEFGDNPEAVNAYAASTFFAVDRYASYQKDWRNDYAQGVTILTDRYTTSNAIHQGSKLPADRRQDFFKWLYDFEFGLMELPKPDIVLYMDIPIDAALERIGKRRAETGSAADIHERDADYLRECWKCGDQAADYYGWRRVPCFAGGRALTAEEIHENICRILKQTEKDL
jgi:dTMP kinase